MKTIGFVLRQEMKVYWATGQSIRVSGVMYRDQLIPVFQAACSVFEPELKVKIYQE